MPSFDILALFKDIIAFFKSFRPKITVKKELIGNKSDPAVMLVANMTDNPVTIVDLGFVFNGHDFTVDDDFFQPSLSRVEFPQTIEPRTSLTIRIRSGAMDVWKDGDVYVIDFARVKTIHKVEFNFPSAR